METAEKVADEAEKAGHIKRPMNAFLMFCKCKRSLIRQENPDIDNRNVTRLLGDRWANLKEDDKLVYIDMAKKVCYWHLFVYCCSIFVDLSKNKC